MKGKKRHEDQIIKHSYFILLDLNLALALGVI